MIFGYEQAGFGDRRYIAGGQMTEASSRPPWPIGLAVLILAATACGGSPAPGPAGGPPAEAAAPPAPRGDRTAGDPSAVSRTAHTTLSGVTLELVDARRLTAATIEVTLSVSYASAEPQAGPLDAARLFTGAGASGPPANPAAGPAGPPGGLADSYVTDAAGTRRFFVLRDAGNDPLCSFDEGPMATGERRMAWVRFGAIPGDLDRVDLHVPGFDVLAGIPIP
jgi:hypothetical protein